MSEDFEVPDNYFISMGSFGPKPYRMDDAGNVYVTVYKSLDHGNGDPPVQHVVNVGNFVVRKEDAANSPDLLRNIRKGIEALIKKPSSS
ncbi:hypothetical protein HY212_05345 [Candidatus Pacearchaeota archaeon]|nr:hypothetical protein [Candidatus Pacearchaeota archaeon]